MKMIYMAYDSDICKVALEEKLQQLTVQAHAEHGDQLGLFITANLVKRGQISYSSDEERSQVENMMSLMRKFDEIWLVGTEVLQKNFDDAFKMEFRVANADGVPINKYIVS